MCGGQEFVHFLGHYLNESGDGFGRRLIFQFSSGELQFVRGRLQGGYLLFSCCLLPIAYRLLLIYEQPDVLPQLMQR